MIIRNAKIEDFTNVFELVKVLWDYNTYEFNRTYEIYSKILYGDNTFAYVVEKDNEIIGFCHGDYFQTLWMCGETCYLSGIIIKSSFRGKGIGQILMKHIKSKAVEYGCKAIILESGILRRDAHKFYERFGFEKSCYGFEMIINKD